MDLLNLLKIYIRGELESTISRISSHDIETLLKRIDGEVTNQLLCNTNSDRYSIPYANRYKVMKQILETELLERSNRHGNQTHV